MDQAPGRLGLAGSESDMTEQLSSYCAGIYLLLTYHWVKSHGGICSGKTHQVRERALKSKLYISI